MPRLFLLLMIALACAGLARAQEPLAAARELYATAAYEDALVLLGRSAPSEAASFAATEADVLRAFCLLALRRDDEAKAVIQAIVIEQPMYVPAEDDASPRIRSAFREVRQKLLPGVVRQLYQSAKASYERKEHLAAAAKFSDLVQLLEDPEVAADDSLADLRLLADGFRQVSEASARSIATAANVTPQRRNAVGTTGSESNGDAGPAATNSSTPPVPALPNSNWRTLPVVPPVAVNQQLPPWKADPVNRRLEHTGAIELVIDEQGLVESVSLRDSIHPLYDPLLLEAAKVWTYQPARRGEQPIKFHKTLVVKLNGR